MDEHATETATFVETALKLGGASEEEAKKTGALDRADEQIEDLFAPKYQTAGSPAHRAVWDKEFPIDIFVGHAKPASPAAQAVMDKTIELVKRLRDSGNLFDEKNKIREERDQRAGQSWLLGLVGRSEVRRLRLQFRRIRPVPGEDGRPSTRRPAASRPSTAASAPSTRSGPSAAPNRRKSTCPSWQAASGSPPSL